MKILGKCIILIFLITGCSTIRVDQYHIDPYDKKVSDWSTDDVLLIADTQIHENKGVSSRFLGKAADKVVTVTLRPAQQTIGAPETFWYVIMNTPDNVPIIHLGDALDISCNSEWETFSEIIEKSGSKFVFIPGNHDGYLAGNIHPIKGAPQYSVNKDYWHQLCDKGRYYDKVDESQKALDKTQLVKKYLELFQTVNPNYELNLSNPKKNICDDSSPFVKCIAWNLDYQNPWRSYVIQAISLPTSNKKEKFSILLFDTSNYYLRPKMAGEAGEITNQQLNDAIQILSHLDEDTILFGGHHPLNSLQLSDSEIIKFQSIIHSKSTIPFYVSAHTHNGYWKFDKTFNLYELNIGSLNDAPNYYRSFRIKEKSDGYIINSKVIDLADYLEDSICKDILLPSEEEPHSVEKQKPKGFFSTIYYFFAFWKSKHDEIKPEFYVYRDLIKKYVPDSSNHTLHYIWEDNYECNETSLNVCKTIKSREKLFEEISYLSKCDDPDICSERRKARFLIALNYFLDTTLQTPWHYEKK